MIENQRHLFDIPDDVAYLNCAYMSPLMTSVQEAGRNGIADKGRPWMLSPPDFFSRSWDCRSLFADLINAPAENVAIVPSASYGLAVAARNLKLEPGQEIIVLEDQFPSNVYVWRELAAQRGGTVRTVLKSEAARYDNEGLDWTAAMLDAITERTAIVAAANCHWTDGALIDVERVAERARDAGAALVLDITQSGGAWPFDAARVRPDFLICACYKWLMGPYSLGFLYVDPKWHGGEPLEYNWIARRRSEDFGGLVDYEDSYQDGALRFDMGERSNFHLMPMAARPRPAPRMGGGGDRGDAQRRHRGDRRTGQGARPDRQPASPARRPFPRPAVPVGHSRRPPGTARGRPHLCQRARRFHAHHAASLQHSGGCRAAVRGA